MEFIFELKIRRTSEGLTSDVHLTRPSSSSCYTHSLLPDVYQSVCLSVCLPACLPVDLSIYLSITGVDYSTSSCLGIERLPGILPGPAVNDVRGILDVVPVAPLITAVRAESRGPSMMLRCRLPLWRSTVFTAVTTATTTAKTWPPPPTHSRGGVRKWWLRSRPVHGYASTNTPEEYEPRHAGTRCAVGRARELSRFLTFGLTPEEE